MKYINNWSIKEVESHLNKTLNKEIEVARFFIAGEGNMNFTYRVITTQGDSFIMKQSPPFCAKFPSIPAPASRILSEIKYYDIVRTNEDLAHYSPKIHGFDEEKLILYMSDLGEGNDFETLYNFQTNKLDSSARVKLVSYLRKLHNIDTDCLDVNRFGLFENKSMRELNSDYIFKLPFDPSDTAIDLNSTTPGLHEVALSFKENSEVRAIAQKLSESYWKDTKTLLHGDYYPRSWLTTTKGLFIIDPEFAYYGIPEFDLSVYLAHMSMCNDFNLNYMEVKNTYGEFDEELLSKLIAVEIFRRIIYVSQLPLYNSLKFKKELLDRSKEALLTGRINSFFGEIDA